MSMSDIHMDITNLLLEGVTPSVIASELKVPVTWVYPVMKRLEQEVLQSNTEPYSPFNTFNS